MMGDEIGAIKFKNGDIKYYEYNGTSDVVISHIYDTLKEVYDNWKNHKWMMCECNNEEKVRVYSNYGGGFTFDGLACRKCKSLRTKRDEDKYGTLGSFFNEKIGIPDWVIEDSNINIPDYKLRGQQK